MIEKNKFSHGHPFLIRRHD